MLAGVFQRCILPAGWGSVPGRVFLKRLSGRGCVWDIGRIWGIIRSSEQAGAARVRKHRHRTHAKIQ